MTTQAHQTDVTSRRSAKTVARLSAAAAVIALLLSGAVAGADAPAGIAVGTDTAPTQPAVAGATTRPSFVTDGLNADGGLRVISGKGTVLTTRTPYKRVSIGQPDIADVNTIGPSTVLVTAKKAGSTQLILWDDQDRSQVVDVIVELDLAAVKRQIKAAFPDLAIEVSALNDTIALRGQVPSVQSAEQAVELSSTYAKVHNFLEVSGGQQVMLQVRFAEVSKSATKNLGINFGGTDGVSTFGNNIGQVNPLSFTSGTGGVPVLGVPSPNGAVTIFGQGAFSNVSFAYFISALRENGLVRMLAEPNLIAISGQEASFVAGGEFPVPVSQGGGGSGGGSAITVNYREFGVKLNFIPLVLGNGKIRLKVAPEVSDLDFSNAVRANGFLIPALTKRRVMTTVELADGQSFALAGLLNNNVSATIDSVPLLGDIPILGQLFRSTKYLRKETELVVLVTPRLVAPMNPDQVPLLPGEHWRYPSDWRLYGLSDVGGPVVEPGTAGADKTDKTGKSTTPPPQFHGSYGYTPVGAGNVTPVAQ